MRTAVATTAFLALTLLAPAQQPAQPKQPAAKLTPTLPKGVMAERDVAYGPHERNKLDLYYPESNTPLPVIIWVHGGAWKAGSKDDSPPALRLLTKGYAVASINYRYSTQATFPAQIEDCKAAVRWLRANAKNYHLDTDHFGAWGASAGGHLVALMGTAGDAKEFDNYGGNPGVSSRVQAVCDVFGPTDFSKEAEQSGPNPVFDRTKADAPEAILIGGLLAEHPDRVKRANPITYIKKDCPPFLIIHGDKDPLVPVEQSKMLDDALKAAGVESTLVVVPGAGHGPGIDTPERRKQVEEFFDKHLKAKK
jgi:acetyl esterase/lipase